jgi:hypothetical protein
MVVIKSFVDKVHRAFSATWNVNVQAAFSGRSADRRSIYAIANTNFE